MKWTPILIGGAVALGAWFVFSQRGQRIIGMVGSDVYPADTTPGAVSNTSLAPSNFSFPPLPSLGNLPDLTSGCCSACVPSRRVSTASPSDLPILDGSALGPAMPTIAANAPTPAPVVSAPVNDNIFYMSSYFHPAVAGPSRGIAYAPIPDSATRQEAPYTTVIVTAQRGNTAPGFSVQRAGGSNSI